MPTIDGVSARFDNKQYKATMHLMYHIDENTGHRVYTLKKVDPNQKATVSAHPARFSPDDKFSKQRIKCKRRFNLLPTQQPRAGF